MFLVAQKGYDVTYFHMNWQAYRWGSGSYSSNIRSSSLRLNSPCVPSFVSYYRFLHNIVIFWYFADQPVCTPTFSFDKQLIFSPLTNITIFCTTLFSYLVIIYLIRISEMRQNVISRNFSPKSKINTWQFKLLLCYAFVINVNKNQQSSSISGFTFDPRQK